MCKDATQPQGAEVQYYLVVVPGFIPDRERDVLFSRGYSDRFIDQFHRFLPDRVFDLVAAQGEDTITGKLTTLIDLESLIDDGLKIVIGVL